MGWFPRRKSAVPDVHRQETDDVRKHLEEFVRTRVGVEAFVEPVTSVTPPTVLLIATTGEWTRRRIHNPKLLGYLSQDLAIPVYDVQLVGYPQRMRDWNARQRLEEKKARRLADGG
jgi:hypothetical protein